MMMMVMCVHTDHDFMNYVYVCIFSLVKEWHHSHLKGCFFLEEDGSVVSLQYRLDIPQHTTVYLSIQPLNLSQTQGKHSAPPPTLGKD